MSPSARVLTLASVACVFFAQVAYTQVPLFPNNIVAFPERDFITIEGFPDYAGKSLTVEVYRNNALVGSAAGVVSGTAIAFEINHPGALCWGDNTPLKVTPNLVYDDVIKVKYGQSLLASSIVQNGAVTTVERVDKTLTIKGYIGGNVNKANIEQRIVNPDLVDMDVAKRAISALPNAPVATNVYTATLTFDGNNFVATYVFTQLSTAIVASEGQMRVMTWEFTDADGNRQGLTISEFGEVGGPYSALCPPSPDIAEPLPISIVSLTNNLLTWNDAIALPGSPDITHYDIKFIDKDSTFIDKDSTFIGIRAQKSTGPYTRDISALLQLLPRPTTLEIRPMVYARMTQPLILDYSSTLSYDANAPIVAIAATLVSVPTPTPPLPPSGISVVQANSNLKVSWAISADTSIDIYKVTVYRDGIAQVDTYTSSLVSVIVSNLVPGVLYQFTVSSHNNLGWGTESAMTMALAYPKPVDIVTITSARWDDNKILRVKGTSTDQFAKITLYFSPVSPLTIRGTTTPIFGQVSPVIVGTSYVYDIQVTKTSVPFKLTNDTMYAFSDKGGWAGPVRV
jgi:hypothetical protein